MGPMLRSSYNAIIRSLTVRPSTQGNICIVQSLCILGTITASICTITGWTNNWIQVDPLLQRQLRLWIPSSSLSSMNHIDKNPNFHSVEEDGDYLYRIVEFSKVFVRVLFVPSVCEEIIWRVLLQPQPSKSSSVVVTTGRILIINALYTMSHVIHAQLLSLFLLHHSSNNIRSNRSNDDITNVLLSKDNTILSTKYSVEQTVQVFMDPSFLFIAFCLGNVCSYSYIRSGYALYAPVLIHTISVSIWLTCLGGNTKLGRGS